MTETIVDFYIQIHPQLDLEMEKCLYAVIRILTDTYIDDEKNYRRLTEMIDENTSSEAKEHFQSTDGLVESLKYREEELAEKDRSLSKAHDEINKLKSEIRMLKTQPTK